MSTPGAEDLRLTRLSRFFSDVIHERKPVTDPAACVSKILSSKSGLSALQTSVRFDTSISFLNNHATKLLLYLQEESLRTIDSGSVLSKILLRLVEPPYFWDASQKPSEKVDLPSRRVASSASSASKSTRHPRRQSTNPWTQDQTFSATGPYSKSDELLSRERSFFRTADFLDDPEHLSSRSTMHVDNQFRLLREDMVGEIRDELTVLQGHKPGYHKGTIIDNLRFSGVQMDTVRNSQPWGVRLEWDELLPQLRKFTNTDKRFTDDATLSSTLFKAKGASNIKLVQLDSAIFAFEPFLRRLQEIINLPLEDELVNWQASNIIEDSFSGPPRYSSHPTLFEQNLTDLGTGKTFLGALAGKVLYDATNAVILVMCFTNHALDQFHEDLIKVGIPPSDMIRLGAQGTDQTRPLRLRDQPPGKLKQTQWAEISRLKLKLGEHEKRLTDAFSMYHSANITKKQIMEYLEFAAEALPFFETFIVPDESEEDMRRVGRRGKNVDCYYLLDRWIRGVQDAGAFRDMQQEDGLPIWSMLPPMREACMQRWRQEILGDLIDAICQSGRAFNADQTELSRILAERDANLIKTKRVIGCTTNGAASYFAAIQASSPGIVLVEEAGEILESHILTALGPRTQQLILIGDHQQLRPKCSFPLQVEQGDGFDLNRSLSERLILRGFPHMPPSTRNRPDLRGFTDNVIFLHHTNLEVELKEKELRDSRSSTKQNDFEAQMILKCVRYLAQQGYGSDKLVVLTPYLGQLRLLRDKLADDNDPILNDLDKLDLIKAGLLTDTGPRNSKPPLRLSTIDNYQGEESDIVLVSLTRSNNSGDIGFMSAPERLNVLLSRSRNALIMIGNVETFENARKGHELWRKAFRLMQEKGHIYDGFPIKCEKHPDRKARLSLPEDFDLRCPDGGCTEPCSVLLSCGKHKCPSSCHQIVDHSKIQCRAPEQKRCTQKHKIHWLCFEGKPKSCHACERERKNAERKAQRAAEEQAKRDEDARKHQEAVTKIDEKIQSLVEGAKRQRLQAERAAIIAQKAQDLANANERAKRAAAAPIITAPPKISSPKEESTNTTASKTPRAQHESKQSVAPRSTPQSRALVRQHINTIVDHNASPSKTEWQRQKDQLNAVNSAIDEIMAMSGLEEVKAQILRIKAKVDTSVRQGTNLTKERLGFVLLGNPGTGKTTVARHYAKALAILQILPGDGFVETTGARLANGGINEVKDHLKQLQNAGGGVYFIDEAYQLTEAHNPGGKSVLDFLRDLGLLSNGEVAVRNPAHFIGAHIGQSEAQTKAILATTVGKVLIIDEAYSLGSGKGEKSNGGYIFKTAVIDTIVAEVQGVPGDDRCVILLGYEDKMEEMFRNVNQRLTRRFQLSNAFRFEDFTDSELQEILLFKLDKKSLGATSRALAVAIDVLSRSRNKPNFGNGGDVESLIGTASINYQNRQKKLPDDEQSIDFIFEPEDFDPDYNRTAVNAGTNLQELFKDVFGCEGIIAKLDGYIRFANGMRARGLDPQGQIPMNFIFKGPPGTGKTTTARRFGQVFYDLGFLSTVEVVECTVTNLVGEYVGYTGPKTIDMLEKGLGKVLFIDEAYRLGESRFAQEAISEIVDCVTKPKFEGKLVIILAGYDKDMNDFLRVNEGLGSRFPDEIIFPALSPGKCLDLLESKLKESRIDVPSLRSSPTYDQLLTPMTLLSRLPDWGSARDVETLAKSMVRSVFENITGKVDQLILPHDTALLCINDMLSSRRARSSNVSVPAPPPSHQPQQMLDSSQPPTTHSTATGSSSNSAPPPSQENNDEPAPPNFESSFASAESIKEWSAKHKAEDLDRDDGVSTSTWTQIIVDKLNDEQESEEAEFKNAMRLREETRIEEIREAEDWQHMRALQKQHEQERKEEAEQRRKEQDAQAKLREQARIREVEAKEYRDRMQRELERQRKKQEERRKKEKKAQLKLREMGVCVQGYRWIKQAKGYRCAGGSHFVSDSQLGL
ncbi:related to stage V sporulation protein K [Phialocephala subalpina]|uniref:Related to stage V sporulation protein K n=1 Tax=Phialocephala subalpina TaxID=576137 RepID=A0A1L7X8F6_9HELO|nr:related to stage V sporulation protein K [Phialocephala subalpina]